MKTDNVKGEYITKEGVEPTIEIEVPRKVTERHGGKLIETEHAAFVKFYTSFKKELRDIEGNDLKVWVFIVLSVNRITKDARPGLREIAEKTGLAVNTVRSCVERLDEKNLLDVVQEAGRGNIYRPSDYVSVSKTDTVTVSKKEPAVSKNTATVSASLLQNAQLEELELTRGERDTPDAKIFQALENLTGGLNTSTPRFVDTWREKHPPFRILEAIALAKTKGRKPVEYVDGILQDWEANGYPKTREEKVQERKSAKTPQAPKPDNFVQELAAKKLRLQQEANL